MKKLISAVLFMSGTSALAETAAESGSAFSVPGMPMLWIVVGALLVAFIVLAVLRGQLKTATHQSGAAEYERKGSFELFIRRDRYSHTTEQRRRVEQNKN